MTTPVPYEQTPYRRSLPDDPPLAWDPRDAPPRLNVFVPHLSMKHSFGGVASALELGGVLAGRYPEARFLSLSPLPPELFDLPSLVRGQTRVSPAPESCADGPIACHARDVFFCTYWPTVLAWRRHAGFMERAGHAANPFYYFIQDWEPGFYPMGAKQMIAESTYGHGDDCFAVFNSQELACHFQQKGYGLSRTATLSPSLNQTLREILAAWNFQLPPKSAHRMRLLVYGRPHQPRNCFAVILEGLARYLSALPGNERGALDLVSAGLEHESIELAPGAVMASLGKLSLKDYAALLAQSHVGVSLMASPHPSYPPLEMAAFGLEVVTNGYACKDLSRAHPYIRSVSSPEPGEIARELELAVQAARQRAGRAETARLPENLSPEPWDRNIRSARLPRLDPVV